eukprot:SAG11_NODE_1123_length_5778_cov_4.474027_6_plen_78_part_00
MRAPPPLPERLSNAGARPHRPPWQAGRPPLSEEEYAEKLARLEQHFSTGLIDRQIYDHKRKRLEERRPKHAAEGAEV